MYAALETDPRVGFRPGIVPLAGLGHIGGGGRRGWAPTLGGISADEAALLVADGLDSGDVSLASSLGATDSDAEAILALNNQDAEISALDTLIQNLNTGATAAQLAQLEAAGVPTGTPSPAGQSPAGSILQYQANYSVNTLIPGASLLVTPTEIISDLSKALAGTNLSISSVQTTSYGANGFVINVQDNIGHALLSDVKGVLDSALNSVAGIKLTASNLYMVAPGGSGQALVPASGTTITSTPPPPATSLSTWFENNAATIGIFAVVALVAVSAVKKL